MEFQLLEPPGKTKTRSRNREIENLGDKIAAFDLMKQFQGKPVWFELTGFERGFEKSGFHLIRFIYESGIRTMKQSRKQTKKNAVKF